MCPSRTGALASRTQTILQWSRTTKSIYNFPSIFKTVFRWRNTIFIWTLKSSITLWKNSNGTHFGWCDFIFNGSLTGLKILSSEGLFNICDYVLHFSATKKRSGSLLGMEHFTFLEKLSANMEIYHVTSPLMTLEQTTLSSKIVCVYLFMSHLPRVDSGRKLWPWPTILTLMTRPLWPWPWTTFSDIRLKTGIFTFLTLVTFTYALDLRTCPRYDDP